MSVPTCCPWCQSESVEPYFRFAEAGVDYLTCSRCKVVFAAGGHQRHDYQEYDYTQLVDRPEEEGGTELAIGFDRVAQAEYLYERFRAATAGTRYEGLSILDAGCGPADFLALVNERCPGVTVAGMDPSRVNAAEARERHGIRVHQQYWHEAHDARYDIITMFGNLMLHESPLASLRLAYERLRPGGLMLFEVKNPESATRRLLRSARPFVMNHRISRQVYRQAFHGMPWGLPASLLKGSLEEIGFTITSLAQRPGRNADLSRQRGVALRMSALLDRTLQAESWIECIAQKPTAADLELDARIEAAVGS